jgi:hypothetical protein
MMITMDLLFYKCSRISGPAAQRRLLHVTGDINSSFYTSVWSISYLTNCHGQMAEGQLFNSACEHYHDLEGDVIGWFLLIFMEVVQRKCPVTHATMLYIHDLLNVISFHPISSLFPDWPKMRWLWEHNGQFASLAIFFVVICYCLLFSCFCYFSCWSS